MRKRLCLYSAIITLAAILPLASSCRKEKRQPSPVPPASTAAPAAADEIKKPRVGKPPLAGGTYGVVAPEVLGDLAGDPAVKALQKSGLLKAAIPCKRENLCVKMQYGVAVGFEVELIRKMAGDALGVKENILDENDSGADIRAAVPCGAPGAGPVIPDSPDTPFAGPYYFSARTGWSCFQVLHGGRAVAQALDRIIAHFYKTGTFQQVYKNWFVPAAPDITRTE